MVRVRAAIRIIMPFCIRKRVLFIAAATVPLMDMKAEHAAADILFRQIFDIRRHQHAVIRLIKPDFSLNFGIFRRACNFCHCKRIFLFQCFKKIVVVPFFLIKIHASAPFPVFYQYILHFAALCRYGSDFFQLRGSFFALRKSLAADF